MKRQFNKAKLPMCEFLPFYNLTFALKIVNVLNTKALYFNLVERKSIAFLP
jgi:hypothetical protein